MISKKCSSHCPSSTTSSTCSSRTARRQHPDQGPRRPRPVRPGRERGPDHLRHRATTGQTDSDGNEPPRNGRRAHAVRRDHQRRPLPRRRTPTTPGAGTPESTVSAKPDSASQVPSPAAAPNAELVDAVTTIRRTSRARLELDRRERAGRHRRHRAAVTRFQRHRSDDYPGH